MSSFASKRIVKEINQIKKENLDGIEILFDENYSEINAIIHGPPDTPYENGQFKLSINIGSSYPMKPPSVKFTSNIFHPNVYNDGKICVDILQNEWSPSLKISTILISIRSLLMDPNPDSPANGNAAKLFINDRNKFDETVREFINQNKK